MILLWKNINKLKEYFANIKPRFNQYQPQQEEQNLLREKTYFQRPQKKYKKVVYKEETDSELEIKKKEKEQKQFPSKRKNKISST